MYQVKYLKFYFIIFPFVEKERIYSASRAQKMGLEHLVSKIDKKLITSKIDPKIYYTISSSHDDPYDLSEPDTLGRKPNP